MTPKDKQKVWAWVCSAPDGSGCTQESTAHSEAILRFVGLEGQIRGGAWQEASGHRRSRGSWQELLRITGQNPAAFLLNFRSPPSPPRQNAPTHSQRLEEKPTGPGHLVQKLPVTQSQPRRGEGTSAGGLLGNGNELQKDSLVIFLMAHLDEPRLCAFCHQPEGLSRNRRCHHREENTETNQGPGGVFKLLKQSAVKLSYRGTSCYKIRCFSHS